MLDVITFSMQTTNDLINKSFISEDYTSLKLRMTNEATNIISASIIADKDFPKPNSVPRLIPLPFNNLGHFFMFDNIRFLKIIYQTIDEFKSIVNSRKFKFRSWILSIGIVVLLFITLAMNNIHFDEVPGYYLLAMVVGVFAYYISESFVVTEVNAKLAAYKAKVIEDLLNDNWELNKNLIIPPKLQESISGSSNGILPNNETAILIMFEDQNEQPFPGFGPVQLDNKFICPPKDLDLISEKEELELFEGILTKLQSFLPKCCISNLGFRKVIVINSSSISINSPWLDENKVPLITTNMDINDIYSLDENISVRSYFVIEALFPKYDTAACFFIRPYKAENSVGFHIAITTIGPPVKGLEFLKERLMKYQLEKNKVELIPVANINGNSASKSISEHDLERIGYSLNSKEKFHEKISFSTIKNLDPCDTKNLNKSRFDDEAKKIVDNEISWPGKYYFFKYNIRERKSLTLGGDFFGYPELTSSIATIYDQISRKILESIEELGYDISKYKDKEGKFSINAESIDSIIVGEVINMKSDGKRRKDVADSTRTAKSDESTKSAKQN